MLRIVRVTAGAVAAVVLGAVVGMLGAFQHPTTWTVAGHPLGTGVVAGVAALLLAQLVARDALPLGLGAGVVLVGWTVTVGVLGTSRPEGDLVIPASSAGGPFLYGGFLLGLLMAVGLALSGASGAARARR